MLGLLLKISLIASTGLAACADCPNRESTAKAEYKQSAQTALQLSPGTSFPVTAISPLGDVVVSTGTTMGTVDVWKVNDASRKSRIGPIEDSGGVSQLVFSPDGSMLLVGSYAADDSESNLSLYRVSAWEIRTGKRLFTSESHHSWGVAAAFSPDSRLVAFSLQEGKIEIVGAKDGILQKTINYDVGGIPETMCFSSDGKQLAVAGILWLRIWNLRSGDLIVTANADYVDSNGSPLRHSRQTFRFLLRAETIRWTWRNLLEQRQYRVSYANPTGLAISGAAFSHDLSRVLFWTGNSVRVQRTSDGAILRAIERGNRVPSNVTFTPDGSQIVLETKNQERSISLIDIKTGKTTSLFRGHRTMAQDISFSRSGNKLLATTEFRIYVWDVKTLKTD